jgi:gluconate:H+ symporter, GntP family
LSESDIQLLLTALGGVALLVALIVTRIRLHPLLALLVVSLAVGIAGHRCTAWCCRTRAR